MHDAPTPHAARSAGSGGDSPALPLLRQDIVVHPAARNIDGQPSWVLVDPASGGCFHIGWREFEILSRWNLGAAEPIVSVVNRETALRITCIDVDAVRRFFEAQGLVRGDGLGFARRSNEMRQRQQVTSFAGLLQKMLYVRVPLFDPRPFLTVLTPLAGVLFRRGFWLGLGLVLIAAIAMVIRQWGAFVGSVTAIASLEGAVSIAATLVVAKIAHEFGHAVSATHYGADVPVMGVAFVLGWPMPFTETTAAWTLQDRRQRIVIAIAGVAVESILAVLALLAWSILDAGALRNAAAFAATTLIVLTLIVNINPLMRFDGYFVLAEMAGIDNLQQRAFDLVGWRTARVFAGATERHPEPHLGVRPRLLLEIYGVAGLLYRIVVYVGIIYAIDRLVFPALALPLSLGIAWVFLLKPLLADVHRLYRLSVKQRSRTGLARFAAGLAALLALLFVPWQTSVSIPVLFEAGETFDIFPPEPARVTAISVAAGLSVQRGQILVRLQSPEIEHRLRRANETAVALERLLNQHATSDATRSSLPIHEQELAKTMAELAELERRKSALVVTAPADGRLTFVEPGLWPGLSVAPDRPLAQLVATGRASVVGYADERDLAAIAVGAQGIVWLDGVPGVGYAVRVEALFGEAVRGLDHAILATAFGGPVAARQGPDRRLIPEMGLYKVTLSLGDDRAAHTALLPRTRGFARIASPSRNLVTRIWTRFVGLLRREFGWRI